MTLKPENAKPSGEREHSRWRNWRYCVTRRLIHIKNVVKRTSCNTEPCIIAIWFFDPPKSAWDLYRFSVIAIVNDNLHRFYCTSSAPTHKPPQRGFVSRKTCARCCNNFCLIFSQTHKRETCSATWNRKKKGNWKQCCFPLSTNRSGVLWPEARLPLADFAHGFTDDLSTSLMIASLKFLSDSLSLEFRNGNLRRSLKLSHLKTEHIQPRRLYETISCFTIVKKNQDHWPYLERFRACSEGMKVIWIKHNSMLSPFFKSLFRAHTSIVLGWVMASFSIITALKGAAWNYVMEIGVWETNLWVQNFHDFGMFP